MKRFVCIFLSAILLTATGTFSVGADDITLPCTFDTYTEDNEYKSKDFDAGEILLCGTVYNRCASFRFDISSLTQTQYNGCVMSFWVRNNFAASKITFYDAEDNLITTLTLADTGLVKCEIDITDYANKALGSGREEIGLSVRYDGSVLAVFSSDYTKDKSMRPKLTFGDTVPYFPGQRSFEYPEVTQQDFKNVLTSMTAKGHPYLFGDKEDFDRIKENAFGKNQQLTAMYNNIKSIASGYIDKAPTPITVDISKEANFNRANECYDVISKCAFVYLVEGDEAYADRALAEAEFFASLSSWGKVQFIDNNQIAFGVALCYDWLYDWLDEDTRAELISSLRSNHLDEITDLLKNPDASKYSSTYYRWYFSYNNHATLDNSLTFLQAMATADTDIEASAFLMAETLNNLKRAFDKCYPDAAWYEGISYWSNVGPVFGYVFMCMDNSFGHCFGYEDIPSVMNQSDFPIYMSSSVSSFCFNDSVWSSKNRNSIKYVYGILKDDKALQKYSVENDTFNSPFTILYYDTDADYSNVEVTLPKDKFFRNMDMVTMRSSWQSTQEIFCGMLVQNASATHGHMNSGTITLDALGEQWITNPGRDEYTLDGYWENSQNGKRWKYYFGRAEANGCLVIAPSQDGGQIVTPDDTIDKYVSKERGAYAVTDLTATYAPYASSYQRGIMLCDDRTKFVLQDELTLDSAQEVYSFVNIYKCNAEISEDGKSLVLSKNNKKVRVNILCDTKFELSVIDSKPLSTSPQLKGNRYLPNLKRIAVHFPKTDGFKLRFEFIPYLIEEELPSPATEIIPLQSWDIPDGECVRLCADSIIADGEVISGFNPENRCYTVDNLPQNLTAEADDDCAISYADSSDASAKYVVLTHKETGRKTSYMITTEKEKTGPNIIDVSGLAKLGIKKATASEDDGNVPENAIDDKSNTRWSASGEQFITFELKRESVVNCIAIQFYNGNKRNSYFDLQVSDDGKTWTTLSANESCGTSNDFEYFTLNDTSAKFVRYVGYGTSSGSWNSVCEVNIYGK